MIPGKDEIAILVSKVEELSARLSKASQSNLENYLQIESQKISILRQAEQSRNDLRALAQIRNYIEEIWAKFHSKRHIYLMQREFTNAFFAANDEDKKTKFLNILSARFRASGIFDEEWYLTTNPDVASSGQDPVEHYLLFGKSEGRHPCKDFHHIVGDSSDKASDCGGIDPVVAQVYKEIVIREDVGTIAESSLFDRDWYLAQNPDVAQSSMDPVEHYVRYGMIEGRKPNPNFDPLDYILRQGTREFEGTHPFLDAVKNQKLRTTQDDEASSPQPLGIPKFAEQVREIVQWSNTQDNLVSVIIPCYNYGAFLSEAVRSASNQTYKNIEIIIVDDGSDDGSTASICASFDGGNIRVLHQPNQGLPAARNNGAAAANGEFYLFLDADDILEPTAVSLMLWCLHVRQEVGYVYTWQEMVGDDELVWIPQEFNAFDLLWSNHPSVCSLIRRDAFTSVGGYSDGMVVGYEDWNHWIMLLSKNVVGSRLGVKAYQHRLHGPTMTEAAHRRKRALVKKIRDHSPALYTPEWLSQTKKKWRPSATIVIAVLGRPHLTEELSHELKSQSIRDFETIIVACGAEGAGHESERHLVQEEAFEVQVLSTPTKDLALGRAIGAANARSELIFFRGVDENLSSTALEKLVLSAAMHPEDSFFYGEAKEHELTLSTGSSAGRSAEADRISSGSEVILVRKADYDSNIKVREALIKHRDVREFRQQLVASGVLGKHLDENLRRYPSRPGLARISSDQERAARISDSSIAPRNSSASQPNENDFVGSLSAPSYNAPADVAVLEQASLEVLKISGKRHESYRRKNIPNLFDMDNWKDRDRPVVLYVVPHFTCGGAEQIDLDILRGFKARGSKITIVATDNCDSTWIDRFAEISDDIFEIKRFVKSEDQALNALKYIVISRAADVVFIRNSGLGYRLCEAWRDVTREVAFVDLLHLHVSGADWVRHSAVYDELLARRFVITEDLLWHATQKYRCDRSKMAVIYNGIDLNSFPSGSEKAALRREIRLKLGLDLERPVVLFCGRMEDQKDPLRWIDVADRVRRRRPEVQFVMIGDGALKADVASKLSQIGLSDAVTMLGYRADSREIIAASDVLLLTSKYEGLPHVLLEALACDVPVVATDVGGTREALEENLGAVLDPNSGDDAFADMVCHWIPGGSRAASIRGRDLIQKKFSLERQQNLYWAHVHDVGKSLDRKRRLSDYMNLAMTSPIIV